MHRSPVWLLREGAGRRKVLAKLLLLAVKAIRQNVCDCGLPSGWVATVRGAELSPRPFLLDANTLNVYLVSGMRLSMVTCSSPGAVVFSTRSLSRESESREDKGDTVLSSSC